MSKDLRQSRRLALDVLSEWGIEPRSISVLRHLYNTLFAVTGANGSRYVLRIRRPLPETLSETRARVASEIWWLCRLGLDLGFHVPRIVHTLDGRAVVEREWPRPGETAPQFCALFCWVNGRFLDRSLRPKHLAEVGRLTARLHNDSERLTVPEWFDRARVDTIGTGDDDATVRLFHEYLSPQSAKVVQAVLHRANAARETLGSGRTVFGLIHADIHQYNYLFDRDTLWLIDFDDCGWGHYLYDFAVTLQQIVDRPQAPDLRAALLAGYREIRHLSAEEESLIDSFLMLRQLQDMTSFLTERDNSAFSRKVAYIPAGIDWLARMLRSLD